MLAAAAAIIVGLLWPLVATHRTSVPKPPIVKGKFPPIPWIQASTLVQQLDPSPLEWELDKLQTDAARTARALLDSIPPLPQKSAGPPPPQG